MVRVAFGSSVRALTVLLTLAALLLPRVVAAVGCEPDSYDDGMACVPCSTTCPAGTGINTSAGAPCGPTSDRVCGACFAGEDANDGSSLTCEPCAFTCPAGTGTNGDGGSTCTTTHNAICAPCYEGAFNPGTGLTCSDCATGCAAGTGTNGPGGHACTASADRVCGTCVAGTNFNDDGDLTCDPCTGGACPAGTGNNGTGGSTCTASADRVCGGCQTGTFNVGVFPTCQSCSTGTCPPGAGDNGTGATACTATADRVCGLCVAGVSYNDGTSSSCSSCTSGDCPAGTGINGLGGSVCTPFVDRRCEDCVSGINFNPGGSPTCFPCLSACPAGEGTNGAGGSACNVTTNTTCGNCSAGTSFNDGSGLTCEPCTSCASGEFESSACTVTSNGSCGDCDVTCQTCSGAGTDQCLTCPLTFPPPVDGECIAGCTNVPEAGCRLPAVSGRSLLAVRNDPHSDRRDYLRWRWAQGAATDPSDFGDPTTTDAFFLCVYDGGSLVSSSMFPQGGTCSGKPCWAKTGSGFVYKNRGLVPDGLLTARLKGGAAKRASIVIRAKGSSLETPTLMSASGPVRVQLQRGGDGCFEAVFSAPFLRNNGRTFSDVAD